MNWESVLKIFLVFLSATVLSFSRTSLSAEGDPAKQDQSTADQTAAERSTKEKNEADDTSGLDRADQVVKDAAEQVSVTLPQTRERRKNADYFGLANYSPLDLLIPGKIGITLGYIRSADKSWEVEYLRGNISVPFVVKDLGKMTDERYSLIGRSYFGGNSFNLSYGLSYFDFSLHLGDQLLNRVTGGSYPSLDMVEIQSLGFNLAIGNRWTFARDITFGVDWVSWAQPVFVTNKKSDFLDRATNQQDKDDVDAAMKLIAYFPRLAFLKLQLGILF